MAILQVLIAAITRPPGLGSEPVDDGPFETPVARGHDAGQLQGSADTPNHPVHVRPQDAARAGDAAAAQRDIDDEGDHERSIEIAFPGGRLV